MSESEEHQRAESEQKRSNKLQRAVLIVGIIVLLAGVAGLLYPTVGEFVNRLIQGRLVDDYRREVAPLAENDNTDELLKEAEEYNRWIYGRGDMVSLDEEQIQQYNRILSISDSGIMGYLEIPSIDVSLPIYHGTEEAVLQAGIGHLPGTSLPVGGENTHAVLAGHSGIPSSRLLTDLDQLEEGDLFTVTVLDRTMAYAVDDIQVVKPEDASFVIEEGTDRCTLVTCVPLGVNTHRLLVRGSRTELPEQDVPTEGERRNFMPYILIIGAVVTGIVILTLYMRIRHGRKR